MNILYIIFIFLIMLFMIHSIIPTYYNKYFNRFAIRKTENNGEIMLTFDDGPDPRYIFDILDLLNKYRIKATFFVVAKNAKENEKIIKKIIDEGHKIGVHSLEHKNAMLYSYIYTKKDFMESKAIMNYFGINDILYRPPWGHTNIFSNFFAKKYGFKMIYWDVMAEDWKIDSSPEIICIKLLNRTSANSIICLHDAGENSGGDIGATNNTIEGLNLAIPKLLDKGYKFILP